MPESATTGVPQDPAQPGAQADLTGRALESAIEDFRRWFQAAVSGGAVGLPEAPPETVDLATLLNLYVGLRQEVNLQTRAVRAQQEQTADVVRQLGQAVEVMSRQPAQEDKARPMLLSLVEVYDALALASRETRRAEGSLLPLLEDLEEDTEEEPAPARSFWARWFATPPAPHAGRQKARAAAGRARAALSGLLTGYAMSLDRLERALRKHGLEPIETVGEPFDPERMEVLDAVAGSGRPPGEVVEEVRRGYLYNGRVFRYAQVRVARDPV